MHLATPPPDDNSHPDVRQDDARDRWSRFDAAWAAGLLTELRARKRKTRIEHHDEIRRLFDKRAALLKRYPLMTEAQIASRVGVPIRTWMRWLARLRKS